MKPQLLKDLEAAWKGDLDLLLSLYARDCRFEDKALGICHHGHDGIREAFATAFSLCPDFAVEYGDHLIGGEQGFARWTFTGTLHRLEEGILRPLHPVRVQGMSAMTFDGKRIRTNTDFWNPQEIDRDAAPTEG